MQNTILIKEKIISTIKIRGPILPVHIAKEIGQTILFASAFLSELLSEKKLKISDMRVGNSPIYFIPGQEPQLENFSQHLKSRERDAFILLKEKKILKDKEQEPAIRVALRSIRDFAIPFKKNNEIYWRYFTIPESEIQKTILALEQKKDIAPIIQKQTIEKDEEAEVFNKKIFKKKKISKKKIANLTQNKNEKFFNKIKESLLQKQIEILDILGFNKLDLILRIKENKTEKLLMAYNKKRITELDIIKAHKKAKELNLPYTIFSFGEPSKKIINMIEAIKSLSSIEKIE